MIARFKSRNQQDFQVIRFQEPVLPFVSDEESINSQILLVSKMLLEFNLAALMQINTATH